MERFTFDEMNLMCIYNTGSRQGLLDALNDMKRYLEQDEADLLALTETVVEKLSRMSDADFEALELYPDFDDKEDTDAD